MRYRATRGFTLIELLVVISIIGMLSSVVLASVSAAREKGRIAAGLKFASYNYHALGLDMIGYWNFDSTVPCKAAIPAIVCVPDIANSKIVLKTMTSPVDYTPTSANFSTYVSDNTTTGKGKSGAVSSSNNHYFGIGLEASADVISSGELLAMNLKPENFTMSAWVYPALVAQKQYILSFGSELGELNFAAILITPDSKFECYSELHGISTGEMQGGTVVAGKWQLITCSFNKDGTGTMFIDGRQVVKVAGTYQSSFYDSGPLTRFSVGFNTEDTDYPYMGNYVDDVAIYTSALVRGDVEKLYAAGLPEHFTAYAR